MVRAAEWIRYGKVELSEQTLKDCQDALQLEVGNAAFYKCAQKNAQSQVTEAIFKRLQKQELEHAELIAEMAGVSEPNLPDENCAGNNDAQNLADAHDRETGVVHVLRGRWSLWKGWGFARSAGSLREPEAQAILASGLTIA
jgi:predicted GNAT family acetyltransferase